MKKRIISIVMLVALISSLIVISGCGKKEEKVVKIGAILPLTGPVAMYGKWVQQGMDLACEEINKLKSINGKKLQILYEDSRNDPKTGVSAINKLLSVNKVKVIVSGMTGVSFSLIPIIDKSNAVLFMTIVTHPKAPDQSRWAFRHFINKGEGAKLMASFLYDILKVKDVAILYVNDEGGIGELETFEKNFARLGGKIVFKESYKKGQIDFKNSVAKLKQSKVKDIFLIGYGKSYALAVKQIRESRIKSRLLTSFDIADSFVRSIAGEASEGSIFYAADLDSSNKVYEQLDKMYKDKFNSDLTSYVAYGYDLTLLLAKSIEKVGYSPERIRKTLLEIKDFPGATGNISILPNGDCKTPLRINMIKDGKIIPFSQEK